MRSFENSLTRYFCITDPREITVPFPPLWTLEWLKNEILNQLHLPRAVSYPYDNSLPEKLVQISSVDSSIGIEERKVPFRLPLRFQLCNNNCVILTKTQHTREAKKILARLNIFQNAHIRGLCWFTIVWTKKEFCINYPVPGMIRKWLRTTSEEEEEEEKGEKRRIL